MIKSQQTTAPQGDLSDSLIGREVKLQYHLNIAIDKLYELKKLDKQERIGFTIIDVSSGKTIAEHNQNQNFQAASMIKLFIALAYFTAVQTENLPAKKETIDPILDSIFRSSDNDSASQLMSILGGPKQVTDIITKNYPEFSAVKINDFIPTNGVIYTNSATPNNYAQLLLMLCKNKLPFSDQFLDLISINQRSRFHGSRTKDIVPNNIKVYHKTGSTSRCCGEAGILSPGGDPISSPSIIISAIIDRPTPTFHYESWIDFRAPVIGSIAAAAYSHIGPFYKYPIGRNELSSFEWFNQDNS